MRVLIDTHFVIWLATKPHLVTSREQALIFGNNNVVVSAISFWEIRVKWEASDRRGSRKGQCDPADASAFVADAGFAVEALTHSAAIEPLQVEIDHHDPFDRMLLAHAQHLDARLLTRDSRLVAHPLSLPS